jgi:hypothetical protein
LWSGLYGSRRAKGAAEREDLWREKERRQCFLGLLETMGQVEGEEKKKLKTRGEGAMSLCLQNRGWRREAAEGKQKIKVGGWLVSVREGSEIGEPWALPTAVRKKKNLG